MLCQRPESVILAANNSRLVRDAMRPERHAALRKFTRRDYLLDYLPLSVDTAQEPVDHIMWRSTLAKGSQGGT
jgi:hypothetical protein